MENNIGNITRGTVNFTDHSRTFHGPVTGQWAILQGQVAEVRDQVEAVAPALQPGLGDALRSAGAEAADALSGPEPDRTRGRTALERMKALAAGMAAGRSWLSCGRRPARSTRPPRT